jgi:propanol-preferring alcohol dehydrogenase
MILREQADLKPFSPNSSSKVANITRRDIAEFLPIAARVPLAPRVEVYPLAQVNRALLELKQGKVHGAKVLQIG